MNHMGVRSTGSPWQALTKRDSGADIAYECSIFGVGWGEPAAGTMVRLPGGPIMRSRPPLRSVIQSDARAELAKRGRAKDLCIAMYRLPLRRRMAIAAATLI